MKISALFSGLWERGLMSPSYLSKLIMFLILPAQFSFLVKKRSLRKLKENLTGQQIQITSLAINGLETYEIKVDTVKEYKISFVGNAADCVHEFNNAKSAITKGSAQLSKNLIFWNYPGVGASRGRVDSVHDLFSAGYHQVKRLLDHRLLLG